MRVLHSVEALASVAGPTHLAIGVFDGIHVGHQAVMGQTVRNARQTGGSAIVVTFDPHPVRVLRPEKAPRLLTASEQKRRLMEELGLDAMLIIPFSHEFSRTAADVFIRQLHCAANGLHEICVGEGWRFGADRSGESCLLQSITQDLGIALNAVPPVLVGGRIVSSTRVRAALEGGNLHEASLLLGRPFSLWGTITPAGNSAKQFRFVPGDSRAVSYQLLPDGMYAVKTRRAGTRHRGAVNIRRPSPAEPPQEHVVELRILDSFLQISGDQMEVSLLQYLRPETSAGNLSEQLMRDALWAKEIHDMENCTEEEF